MPIISHDVLEAFASGLMSAAGTAPPDAELTAKSLVAANLRGVDSHGVRLLPFYVAQLRSGDMDANARGRVVRENGACLLFDAQNGIGQVMSAQCCDHATRLARAHGVGLVTARNSNHFGAAAFWGARIAQAGQIGIVLCNASRLVPPFAGTEPRIGTNPICVAVPGPWLLDMSTTTVAANRIFDAVSRKIESIPGDWALNSAGEPTSDPMQAAKGLLLPLGGLSAGHKGSGLAAAVEILCAVMSGGAMAGDVGSMRDRGRPVGVSQTFLAIDVERFMPIGEFRSRLDSFIKDLKSASPAEGYDQVLVAGEPEWRMEEQRLRSGIPIPAEVWHALTELGTQVGVNTPGLTEQLGSER